MARTSELRPKVGTVTEDKYDAGSMSHKKTWVSHVHETDAVIKVTYTTTHHYRAGAGIHDFYEDDPLPDGSRVCHYCHVSKPGKNYAGASVSVKRGWDEKCPADQLRTHTSTQTSQKYLVIAGPKAGKRLTEAEAGGGFVSYNRSSRWGKSDLIPKVVLIPVSVLKRK
jgi:hypothetical protein